MRIANEWRDYELIDASAGERLERWKDVILIRPDPQIIWINPEPSPLWESADARYIRSSSGGGEWEYFKKLPESWEINYKNLRFKVKPTGFKHTGLFPEQAVNWDLCGELIKGAGRPVRVLNLFAYTGGATLACAEAGAEICHLDAVKNMVEWASENAALSRLSDRKIRWLTDDAMKFIAREKRRKSKYDAIILDPPSYGRGTGGEVWKLEDSLFELVQLSAKVLSQKPLFFLLNSYTTGLGASVMQNILNLALKNHGGQVKAYELCLPTEEEGIILPCGNSAFWKYEI